MRNKISSTLTVTESTVYLTLSSARVRCGKWPILTGVTDPPAGPLGATCPRVRPPKPPFSPLFEEIFLGPLESTGISLSVQFLCSSFFSFFLSLFCFYPREFIYQSPVGLGGKGRQRARSPGLRSIRPSGPGFPPAHQGSRVQRVAVWQMQNLEMWALWSQRVVGQTAQHGGLAPEFLSIHMCALVTLPLTALYGRNYMLQ